MMALVLTEQGPMIDPARPIPVPAEDEVLVHVDLAGICSTDLAMLSGYKGNFLGVLGHEFVGTVVAAAGHDEWLGQRVVAEINVVCGQCDRCRRGLAKHCRNRRAVGISGYDGAFAEYMVAPVKNLHPIPTSMTDRTAVFVEPLAAALRITEQVVLSPETVVYQFGDECLGMLIAQVMMQTGCRLTVIGRRDEKAELLAQLGVGHAVRLGSSACDALFDHEADVVIEVTGSPDGFALASRLVRPQGTLMLKSTYAGFLPNFDASRLVVDEITVIGGRCGPFVPAIDLLNRGVVQVEPLITDVFPLAQGVAALSRAAEGGVLKVMIKP